MAVRGLREFDIVGAGSAIVMAGHSRSKNGVGSLAYVPAIHVFGFPAA
jgi:hypothetical protein